MKKITLDTTIKQFDEKLLTSDLGDEVVMMNIENGDYIGLNEIGNIIWKSIKEPIKVGTLCDNLRKEFDVTEEECEASVLNFLEKMQNEQMIIIL